MVGMVSIWDIAKRLGIEPTTVRRFIARVNDDLGVELHRGKGDKLFLSREDAGRVIAAYEARRGPIQLGDEASDKFDRFGYFYLIQLVPEAIPNRIKIGFADDVDKRLGEHRTAAPTAKLLRFWPCKRSWDYAAMDCVTREGCKLVLNEVYEGEVDGFVTRAEAFFAVMPSRDTERELSENSPLFVSTEPDGGERKTVNNLDQPDQSSLGKGLQLDQVPSDSDDLQADYNESLFTDAARGKYSVASTSGGKSVGENDRRV